MATPGRVGGNRAAVRLLWAEPRVALLVGLATVLTLVALVPLSLAAHQFRGGLSQLLVMAPFALVGVIVAARQPKNPIGWILLSIAAVYTVGTDAGVYAVLAFRMGHPHLPLARLAVALTQCWVVLPMLLPLPIVLFPDGRLPSPRWRASMRVYLAVCVALLVGISVKDSAAFTVSRVQVDGSGELLGFNGSSGGFLDAIGLAGFLALAIISLSWVTYQVVAYRHAIGQRRQQLKWMISGGAVAVIGFVLSLMFNSVQNPSLRLLSLGFIGVTAIPIGIGVGVMKYRLYEIDRIISRTTAYLIVSGLLVATYAISVTLASSVLPHSSSLVVAVATLTAAAIARPLLRRVQELIDRRFNRARYDAANTVEAFGHRLRNEVDPDKVREDLIAIATATLQPDAVTIWIRQ
jgi:hypothetical protein